MSIENNLEKEPKKKISGRQVAATALLAGAGATLAAGVGVGIAQNEEAKHDLASASSAEWKASEGNHVTYGDTPTISIVDSVTLGDQDAAGNALRLSKQPLPNPADIDRLITPTTSVILDTANPGNERLVTHPHLRDDDAQALATEAAHKLVDRNIAVGTSIASGLGLGIGGVVVGKKRKE
jgi:hypothetical protein